MAKVKKVVDDHTVLVDEANGTVIENPTAEELAAASDSAQVIDNAEVKLTDVGAEVVAAAPVPPVVELQADDSADAQEPVKNEVFNTDPVWNLRNHNNGKIYPAHVWTEVTDGDIDGFIHNQIRSGRLKARGPAFEG